MANIETLKETLAALKNEISKVIIGQEDVVDLAIITIFSGGHAIVEGVPGIAKTLLVRTLAKTMDSEFKRIQFTPDLMPSDIVGTNVFNLQKNEFTLVRGPVFTEFLLADEINRAPAKTQSALLQCMQERKVTIDGVDYALSDAFTVFATQNPIEYEGTYPLPEAQKDRFLMMIPMGFPGRDDEIALAGRTLGGDSPEKVLESGKISKVIEHGTALEMRRTLAEVRVSEDILAYMVSLVRATRENPAILAGASPRATQAFVIASRVMAVLNDRDFVTPDDVKALALPILSHRIVLRPEFEIEGMSVSSIIRQTLESVAVPR